MDSVEVFKTTISSLFEARLVELKLRQWQPTWRITFDLDDCDQVLRVQGATIQPQEVVARLTSAGYQCIPLE